jgi:hypothetical protein
MTVESLKPEFCQLKFPELEEILNRATQFVDKLHRELKAGTKKAPSLSGEVILDKATEYMIRFYQTANKNGRFIYSEPPIRELFHYMSGHTYSTSVWTLDEVNRQAGTVKKIAALGAGLIISSVARFEADEKGELAITLPALPEYAKLDFQPGASHIAIADDITYKQALGLLARGFSIFSITVPEHYLNGRFGVWGWKAKEEVRVYPPKTNPVKPPINTSSQIYGWGW